MRSLICFQPYQPDLNTIFIGINLLLTEFSILAIALSLFPRMRHPWRFVLGSLAAVLAAAWVSYPYVGTDYQQLWIMMGTCAASIAGGLMLMLLPAPDMEYAEETNETFAGEDDSETHGNDNETDEFEVLLPYGPKRFRWDDDNEERPKSVQSSNRKVYAFPGQLADSFGNAESISAAVTLTDTSAILAADGKNFLFPLDDFLSAVEEGQPVTLDESGTVCVFSEDEAKKILKAADSDDRGVITEAKIRRTENRTG